MAFENASYITSRGGLLAESSSSIKNKEFLIYSLKGKKSLNILEEFILKAQKHKIIKKNPTLYYY